MSELLQCHMNCCVILMMTSYTSYLAFSPHMKSRCSYEAMFVWLKTVLLIFGTRLSTSLLSANQSRLPEKRAVWTLSSDTLYCGGLGWRVRVGGACADSIGIGSHFEFKYNVWIIFRWWPPCFVFPRSRIFGALHERRKRGREKGREERRGTCQLCIYIHNS